MPGQDCACKADLVVLFRVFADLVILFRAVCKIIKDLVKVFGVLLHQTILHGLRFECLETPQLNQFKLDGRPKFTLCSPIPNLLEVKTTTDSVWLDSIVKSRISSAP
jgi:hypothetical protein